MTRAPPKPGDPSSFFLTFTVSSRTRSLPSASWPTSVPRYTVTVMTCSPVPSSVMTNSSVLFPPEATVMACSEATSLTPSLTTIEMMSGASPVFSMEKVTSILSPSLTSVLERVTSRLSRTGCGARTKVSLVKNSLLL